jgi:flavin reductase (DIM6/NTAB) family NADH-FMN oxidoreductase RutF
MEPVAGNSTGVQPDAFRSALGRFASGVAVVIARDGAGENQGITVSAFCSVSLEPPLVLFCIEKSASLHPVLAEGRFIAVNFLSEHQEQIARRFASSDSRRFDGVGLTQGTGGAPILDGVIGAIECTVTRLHDAGDHTVALAGVDSVHLGSGRPLLYFRGGYARMET